VGGGGGGGVRGEDVLQCTKLHFYAKCNRTNVYPVVCITTTKHRAIFMKIYE